MTDRPAELSTTSPSPETPVWAEVPVLPRRIDMDAAALPPDPDPAAAERPRRNALAVLSLALGLMLSPLAALFGHLAVGQIRRARGGERGLALAWVAVGLGWLWLLLLVIAAGALYLAFTP